MGGRWLGSSADKVGFAMPVVSREFRMWCRTLCRSQACWKGYWTLCMWKQVFWLKTAIQLFYQHAIFKLWQCRRSSTSLPNSSAIESCSLISSWQKIVKKKQPWAKFHWLDPLKRLVNRMDLLALPNYLPNGNGEQEVRFKEYEVNRFDCLTFCMQCYQTPRMQCSFEWKILTENWWGGVQRWKRK